MNFKSLFLKTKTFMPPRIFNCMNMETFNISQEQSLCLKNMALHFYKNILAYSFFQHLWVKSTSNKKRCFRTICQQNYQWQGTMLELIILKG